MKPWAYVHRHYRKDWERLCSTSGHMLETFCCTCLEIEMEKQTGCASFSVTETDSSTPLSVLPEGFSQVRFISLSLETENETPQIKVRDSCWSLTLDSHLYWTCEYWIWSIWFSCASPLSCLSLCIIVMCLQDNNSLFVHVLFSPPCNSLFKTPSIICYMLFKSIVIKLFLCKAHYFFIPQHPLLAQKYESIHFTWTVDMFLWRFLFVTCHFSPFYNPLLIGLLCTFMRTTVEETPRR